MTQLARRLSGPCARPPHWLLQLFIAALLGLVLPGAVSAATLAEADARAVRAVVQGQLDAFAAGDPERAFSYASVGIRAQFGDAAAFMAMVQAAYPMVIQPAGTAFLQPRGSEGAVSQSVQLRDRAGRLWLATYLLSRQVGAGWRIDGCVVRPDTDQTST